MYIVFISLPRTFIFYDKVVLSFINFNSGKNKYTFLYWPIPTTSV